MASAGGGKTALILGGTGETGKQVLALLQGSDAVSRIFMINRRQVELSDPNKVDQKIVDFDKLDEHGEVFKDVDMAFCCLGTTRGKAGKAGFVKVDYDYVVNSAQKLKEGNNCKEFHLMSSWGAKANSWNLYSQTKGKAEEAVSGLGFDRVAIYRPGLLITGREESRTFEKMAQGLAGVFDKGQKYSITTVNVAKAMVFNATGKSGGENGKPEIFEHVGLTKLAEEFDAAKQ